MKKSEDTRLVACVKCGTVYPRRLLLHGDICYPCRVDMLLAEGKLPHAPKGYRVKRHVNGKPRVIVEVKLAGKGKECI